MEHDAKSGARVTWTRERCLEVARQYRRVIDWVDGHVYSYRVARKRGWFGECTAHMDRQAWTKAECLAEAAKHTRRSDWRDHGGGSYPAAKKLGCFDECVAHMDRPPPTYSKDDCLREAAKYTAKFDWQKGHQGTYRAARRGGWFDECAAHMASGWTLEKCLADAAKFTTRSGWQASSKAYAAAKYHGWLDACTAHMDAPPRRWTREACLAEARKYQRRVDWQKASPSSVNAARANGWLADCHAHMNAPPRRWTKEQCVAEARNHDTRASWRASNPDSYDAARRPGREEWLAACVEHMAPPQVEWTEDNLRREVQSFSVQGYWELRRPYAQESASKRGLLHLIDAHFKALSAGLTLSRCQKSAKAFATAKAWHEADPESYFLALERGWFQECTRHMEPGFYASWNELFTSEPIRFLHIYTNRAWDDAVWLGLNRPVGRKKRKSVLSDWPLESLASLKEWGLKAKELARVNEVRASASRRGAGTLAATFDLDEPALALPFQKSTSKKDIKAQQALYHAVFGCDEVFELVTAIIANDVSPADFAVADGVVEVALRLVSRYRRDLMSGTTKLAFCVSVSLRLKEIVAHLNSELSR